jgi:hypothetical protein
MLLPHALRAVQKSQAQTLVITAADVQETPATNSATKTVTASIGTESSDRWVVVMMQYPANSAFTTGRSVNSATIGDISATIGHNFTSTSVSSGNVSFFAQVTSGTTAIMTVNLSGTTNSTFSKFFVYTITGRTTLSFASVEDSGSASETSKTTTTATVTTDNFLISQWNSSSVPTNPVWSGSPSAPTLLLTSPSNTGASGVFDNLEQSTKSDVTQTFSQDNSIICRLVTTRWQYV